MAKKNKKRKTTMQLTVEAIGWIAFGGFTSLILQVPFGMDSMNDLKTIFYIIFALGIVASLVTISLGWLAYRNNNMVLIGVFKFLILAFLIMVISIISIMLYANYIDNDVSFTLIWLIINLVILGLLGLLSSYTLISKEGLKPKIKPKQELNDMNELSND